MIGGRMVLDQGHLTTVDERKLRASVESACARLHPSTAPGRAFAAKLEDSVGAFFDRKVRQPFHVQRHLGDMEAPTTGPGRPPAELKNDKAIEQTTLKGDD